MRANVVIGVVAALLLAVAVFLLVRFEPPRLSEAQVRDALFTTIQREAPEAFLVTGTLELTATTRVENTRVLLPGLLDLDLGTNRAVVRVPGRVSYGFHADSLRPDMVRLLDDGTVEILLPALSIYATEPELAALEVETERGWARLGSGAEAVQQRAVAIVQRAMRQQGEAHLGSSYQPRVNTARALERLLGPALEGLGMEAPRFRFRIDRDLVVEPAG